MYIFMYEHNSHIETVQVECKRITERWVFELALIFAYMVFVNRNGERCTYVLIPLCTHMYTPHRQEIYIYI